MSETIYRVVLHKEAFDEVSRLPSKIKKRVKEAISLLATDPRPPKASKLSGTANAYRIRFADYRLLYEVHAREIVVYVVGIAHRREVYRRLLRRR